MLQPVSSAQLIVHATGLTRQVEAPGGALTILDRVNLDVAAAEAAAVVGPSGSGKSTLLGLLAGLDLPTAGEVRLFGTDLATLDEDGRAALRAGQVGFVFQSFQLIPSLTALENVLLPLQLGHQADPHARALQALAEVGLEQRVEHYPAQLSGGEQQRVALARAFAPNPRLLFADEPTGNLDRRSGQRVAELLFRLRAEHHTSLVLVTHDAALAERCDTVHEMDSGRLRSNPASAATGWTN